MITESLLAYVGTCLLISALIYGVILYFLVNAFSVLIDRKEGFVADATFFFITIFSIVYWIFAIYVIAIL